MRCTVRFWLSLFLLLYFIPEPRAEEILTIGASLPLSGECAEFGAAARNGIELARFEEPKKFAGLRFVYDDNKYEGPQSVSVFNKLLTYDKSDLVFVWGDIPSLAVAPMAERLAVPLVAVLTDYAAVRNYRYVIRFLNSYDQYASALVQYLRGQGYKHLAMVVLETPYYQNYLKSIQSSLGHGESLEIMGSFQPSATDFRTALLKVKRGHFDVLGVFVQPGQIATLYRQAGNINLKIATFGGDDFESNSEVQASQGGMEGALYALHIVDDDFRERYIRQYGNDIHIAYAANAYEFAKLVAFGKEKLPAKQPQAIMDQLMDIRPTTSTLGQFRFVNSAVRGKYFSFPISVKRIRGLEREVLLTTVRND